MIWPWSGFWIFSTKKFPLAFSYLFHKSDILNFSRSSLAISCIGLFSRGNKVEKFCLQSYSALKITLLFFEFKLISLMSGVFGRVHHMFLMNLESANIFHKFHLKLFRGPQSVFFYFEETDNRCIVIFDLKRQLLACSWHQKNETTNSPIHEFKVLQKDQRAFWNPEAKKNWSDPKNLYLKTYLTILEIRGHP